MSDCLISFWIVLPTLPSTAVRRTHHLDDSRRAVTAPWLPCVSDKVCGSFCANHVFGAAAASCDGTIRRGLRPRRGRAHHAVLHQVAASMGAALDRRRHGVGERGAQEIPLRRCHILVAPGHRGVAFGADGAGGVPQGACTCSRPFGTCRRSTRTCKRVRRRCTVSCAITGTRGRRSRGYSRSGSSSCSGCLLRP